LKPLEAGLDPKKLTKIVDEYNEACANNTRAKLVPPNTLKEARPVKKAPFYAVPFQGGMTATFGGPLVNTDAQVLDTENQPIPGLYAIGNAAGFVGCCVVLGVLLAIIIKTFATGAHSEDMLGSFICAGIGGAFMAQIFVNVGMNLRLLPVIGVTLPFYSAGGSSVLMLYICVGLVLSVYMHNTKKLFG
jgi:hypothetical protein